jgi:uncharacterized membrane protein YgaE (UPF0421/DUF939 family)
LPPAFCRQIFSDTAVAGGPKGADMRLTWTGFLHRLSGGGRQAVISVLAAFIAYLPTHLIGLHQGFWSAITAISVAQTEFRDSQSTARKQFTGAAIGGVAGLAVVLGFGDALPVYAAAVALAVLACWLLNIAESSQLAAVTATIILLVPHTGSLELMLFSRLTEVAWGVTVGLAVVWLEDRIIAGLK